jgi:hypothetical protein
VEKIQGYMAKSVTEAVSGEYGRGIGVWKEFLGAEYTEEANPGEFLEQEPDPTDKTLYVILFMVWMEEEKGSSEEQRGRALTYLRHHIDTVGLRPTEFMDCDLLSKARKSAIRTTDEAREHIREREDKEILPSTPEMANHIRVHNWSGVDWGTAAGRDRRMGALACQLMDDSGMRISNLAQDHALRAKEVVAVILRPGTFAHERKTAGPELQAYLRVEREKRPALRGRSRAALFPDVV